MDDIMSTTKQRNYYRNGQLHEETPLREGRFHGIARLWHKNGTPATQEAYQNDLRHGLCRQWNDEGKLLGEYRMDHGTGIQRVWFDNGIVQQERSFFKGRPPGRVACGCETALLLPRNGTLNTERYLKRSSRKLQPNIPSGHQTPGMERLTVTCHARRWKNERIASIASGF
jgi:hypothetical protein